MRAQAYLALADCIKPPDPDVYQALVSGELDHALEEARLALGNESPAAAGNRLSQTAVTAFPHWHNWLEIYYRYFTHQKGRPEVLPVESLYRIWTSDPGATLPFAREKGYLMSDSALHMLALYQQFGIQFPPEYAAQPDHLALQLEFMAFLINAGVSAADQYRFLEDHLTWIGDWQKELADKPQLPFYETYAKVLLEFLDNERNWLRNFREVYNYEE